MLKRVSGVLIIVLFFSVNLFAGTFGKITGTVMDKDSGEPLVGVNIFIENAQLGAATDVDGYFVILNVPPGEYTITASYIGYQIKNIKNVIVRVDLTIQLSFKLQQAAFQGETVTVVAKRPLIQKDATATAAVVSSKELAVAPVETFEQIAQTKAGVNVGPDGKLHFRGGRSDEVGYIVDGIPVTNAISGGNAIDISTNAIEELSIITGSFNAEYGKAMSGIVNIVTREGTSKYSGSFNTQLGDVLTNHTEYFLSPIDKYNITNTKKTEFRLSGPIINNKLTFNVSARFFDDNGYLYGQKLHNTIDINDSVQTGNGEYISLNPQTKYNFQSKLKYYFTNNINFYLTTIYEDQKYQNYSHKRSKVPLGNGWNYSRALQLIFKMDHQLSSRTFYSLALGYLNNDFKHYLAANEFSKDYVWNGYSSGQYFYPGGTDNSRLFRTQQQYTVKLDFTSQIKKTHELKLGLEYKKLNLSNHSYLMDVDRRREPYTDLNNNGIWDNGEPYVDVDRNGHWNDAHDDNGNGIPGDIVELQGWTNDNWKTHPSEISGYIQDKIELKDMIINVGLRYDYFDPQARTLTDPTDPDITKPLKNKNIFHDLNNNGFQDLGETLVSLSERQKYWYRDVKPSMQISPRIAFAFPISSQGKLFFSYGHFFQLPPYSFLYQDYNNRVKPGLIATNMGNPELKPQKTVSYEVGIEQQIGSDWVSYLKIYQRDIRNIIGQDIVILPNTDAYAVFVNRDYGRVRGVNLTLSKQFSSFFSTTVDYTFQVAEGNESNPTKTSRNYRLKLENLKKIVPLTWDQTHALRINTTIFTPGNWMLSMIGRFESGYPYTPQSANEIVKIAEENSGRKIPIIKFDVNIRKSFTFAMNNTDFQFSVFAKIYNLFDRLNENYVWDSTGRATYGLGLYGGKFDPDWQRRPHWFYKPREVNFGFEFTF